MHFQPGLMSRYPDNQLLYKGMIISILLRILSLGKAQNTLLPVAGLMQFEAAAKSRRTSASGEITQTDGTDTLQRIPVKSVANQKMILQLPFNGAEGLRKTIALTAVLQVNTPPVFL